MRRQHAAQQPDKQAAQQPDSAAQQPDRQAARRSDRALEEATRRQHHTATLAQLEALGLSARAIQHRVVAGRLQRLHRGVYAVGPPTIQGRWMAAVMACRCGGDDRAVALLSHRSAAALWGLCRVDASRPVDVTSPTGAGRSRRGIVVHRTRGLHASDMTQHDGIPCTSLPRTLLDLAAIEDRRSLERAIDRTEELRAFDMQAIGELLARNRGSSGTATLAAILAAYDEPTVTRSECEERFLALIEDADLPLPQVNAWIPLADGSGYRADFLWREARLIVEVDGRSYHAKRAAFGHDRRRDRHLALAGFETRRYEASEVLGQAGVVVDEVRSFLETGRRDPVG